MKSPKRQRIDPEPDVGAHHVSTPTKKRAGILRSPGRRVAPPGHLPLYNPPRSQPPQAFQPSPEKPKNSAQSPQPYAVLTAQDRKKMIFERRRISATSLSDSLAKASKSGISRDMLTVPRTSIESTESVKSGIRNGTAKRQRPWSSSNLTDDETSENTSQKEINKSKLYSSQSTDASGSAVGGGPSSNSAWSNLLSSQRSSLFGSTSAIQSSLFGGTRSQTFGDRSVTGSSIRRTSRGLTRRDQVPNLQQALQEKVTRTETKTSTGPISNNLQANSNSMDLVGVTNDKAKPTSDIRPLVPRSKGNLSPMPTSGPFSLSSPSFFGTVMKRTGTPGGTLLPSSGSRLDNIQVDKASDFGKKQRDLSGTNLEMFHAEIATKSQAENESAVKGACPTASLLVEEPGTPSRLKHPKLNTKSFLSPERPNRGNSSSRVFWSASTPVNNNNEGSRLSTASSNKSSMLSTASPGGFALRHVLDTFTDAFQYDDDESNHKEETQKTASSEGKFDPISVVDEKSTSHLDSIASVPSDWHQAFLRTPVDLIAPDHVKVPNSLHRVAPINETPPSVFDLPTQYSRAQNNPPAIDEGEKVVDKHVHDDGMLKVGVIDWSIKRRLRMECFPGRCLPDGSFSTERQQDSFQNQDADQLALELFTGRLQDCGSSSFPDTSPNITALARWKAGLMYWQHPAVHPLPPSILKAAADTRFGNNDSNIEPSKPGNRQKKGKVGGGKGIVPITSSLDPPSVFKKAQGKENDRSNVSTFENGNASHEKSKVVLDLLSSVKGPHAPMNRRARVPGRGSLGGLGYSFGKNAASLSSMVAQREREWQESFRSMFMNWIKRIRTIQTSIQRGERVSAEDLTHVCFYTISPGQVVLFRLGVCESKHGVNSATKEREVFPVIIISSTNQHVRDSLRKMNVKLKKVKELDTGMLDEELEFCEDLLGNQLDAQEELEEEEATQLRNELEALRRAGAQGETVGAEISVSMKKRRSKAKSGAGNSCHRSPRPLFIAGDDDCLAFYEFFLNHLGKLCSISSDTVQPKDTSSTDVPLLLSRLSGPFLHSSLKSLAVSNRREEQHRFLQDDLVNEKGKSGESIEAHSSVEVRGPILPSAVRDLLHASACYLTLDKATLKKKCTKTVHGKQWGVSNTPQKSESRSMHGSSGLLTLDAQKAQSSEDMSTVSETVGSHYLVLHLQTHEGEEYPNQDKKETLNCTGLSTSAWFNGLKDSWTVADTIPKNEHDQDENSPAIVTVEQCNHGEVISMAVWDITRPSMIAYKTDDASSVHPHTTRGI